MPNLKINLKIKKTGYRLPINKNTLPLVKNVLNGGSAVDEYYEARAHSTRTMEIMNQEPSDFIDFATPELDKDGHTIWVYKTVSDGHTDTLVEAQTDKRMDKSLVSDDNTASHNNIYTNNFKVKQKFELEPFSSIVIDGPLGIYGGKKLWLSLMKPIVKRSQMAAKNAYKEFISKSGSYDLSAARAGANEAAEDAFGEGTEVIEGGAELAIDATGTALGVVALAACIAVPMIIKLFAKDLRHSLYIKNFTDEDVTIYLGFLDSNTGLKAAPHDMADKGIILPKMLKKGSIDPDTHFIVEKNVYNEVVLLFENIHELKGFAYVLTILFKNGTTIYAGFDIPYGDDNSLTVIKKYGSLSAKDVHENDTYWNKEIKDNLTISEENTQIFTTLNALNGEIIDPITDDNGYNYRSVLSIGMPYLDPPSGSQ
jgi:hypothetical protein